MQVGQEPCDTIGVTIINFDWGYYKVYMYVPDLFPELHRCVGFRPFSKDGGMQPPSDAQAFAYMVDTDDIVWKNKSPEQIIAPTNINDVNLNGKKMISGVKALADSFKSKENWVRYGKIVKSENGYSVIKE
ncbi:MAG: hypothetical protein HY811_10510 [Planctomycetes bacterium]|nr:hypothetical protein [Planctomycetota bacterium]